MTNEQERLLAQQIHDTLAQELAGAQLMARLLARKLAPTEHAAEAQALEAELRNCLDALRQITG